MLAVSLAIWIMVTCCSVVSDILSQNPTKVGDLPSQIKDAL